MDKEGSVPVVGRGWCRGWCRSSRAPELRCTTFSEVEPQTNRYQSKPSTRSECKEEATGILFKSIDMTPASPGSDRRPEIREFRGPIPELSTHSRQTEELEALPSNTTETGTSQKVARVVDMGGESKKGVVDVAN